MKSLRLSKFNLSFDLEQSFRLTGNRITGNRITGNRMTGNRMTVHNYGLKTKQQTVRSRTCDHVPAITWMQSSVFAYILQLICFFLLTNFNGIWI